DLSKLAKPRIAVVTNVGSAHIENFNSIEDVAAAKRELVESLPPYGIAVLNADDPLVSRFADAHQGRTVLFGLSESAQIRAENVVLERDSVRFCVGNVQFHSSLLGRHGVLNLLAGI